MADDENLQVKNLFYTGNINQCLAVAMGSQAPKNKEAKLERQFIQARALIAQGKPNLVISDVGDSAAPELQAVKLLAQFKQAKQADQQEKIIEQVKSLIGENGNNSSVAVIAATLFVQTGQWDDALRVLSAHSKNLECAALTIQILLKLNRPDLARQQLASVKSWAEDATLAQLAEAWVNLHLGGEQKYQEAFYIFEELGHGASAKILTGQAVCRMHQRKLAEAEELLLESLQKDPNDPETLVNLIVCSQLQGKPAESINGFLGNLKEVAPDHAYLQEYATRESLFDRAALQWTMKVQD